MNDLIVSPLTTGLNFQPTAVHTQHSGLIEGHSWSLKNAELVTFSPHSNVTPLLLMKKKKKNVLKVAKKIDGKFPAERRLSTRPALCFPPKQQELVGQKNITEKKDLTEVTRFFLSYAARPWWAAAVPSPWGAVCRGFSQSQLDSLWGEAGAAQERGLPGSETWEPSGFLSSERWETRATGRVQKYLRVKY